MVQVSEHLCPCESSQAEGQKYFVLFFRFYLTIGGGDGLPNDLNTNQMYQNVNVLIFRRNEQAEYNTLFFEEIRCIKQTRSRLACVQTSRRAR